MGVAAVVNRLNRRFLGAVRRSFGGGLANNITILLGEITILDGEVLLALPWGGNKGGLETKVLELIANNKFENDTCLKDIAKAYKYLHSILELCPAAKAQFDIKTQEGCKSADKPLLHVLTTSESSLSKPILDNQSLSQQDPQLPDLSASLPSSPSRPITCSSHPARNCPKRNAPVFDDTPPTKRVRPALCRNDDRCDPFAVAPYFASGSAVFDVCADACYTEPQLRTFVLRALSNRCRTQRSLLSMATLVAELRSVFASRNNLAVTFHSREGFLGPLSCMLCVKSLRRGAQPPPPT